MKALICHKFAPYHEHTIEEVPAPDMKPGHVRIKIKAAGVNFPDILQVQGQYQSKPPFPFIPGAECSGIITELADDVPYLKLGDRVAALSEQGAFATEALIPMMSVMKISDKMSFEQASAFALVYGTSYYALKNRGGLQKGETLLVLGAAGGVGLATVELGKAMGATVIAAASTPEKLAVCKTHGADHLINYTTENIKDAVKALGGCDMIYDPVGDKMSEPAMRTLKWGGRYLVIGFAGGEIPKIPLNLALLKSIDIRGVFWGAHTQREVKDHQSNMGDIMAMFDSGDIKPRVSNTYPLADFKSAFAELVNRKAMGKVVLTM